jgi:transposase
MYRVDPSTLRRWRRRQRQTGACRTLPRSGRPRRIGPIDEPALRAQVDAHPDATLAAHCQLWQDRRGVLVSVPTMGRALRRLGLTLKKRP